MTTQPSTVPAYLATLRDRLNTRFAADPAFAEVRAYAAPAGDPEPLEMVEWFAVPSHTQEWAANGNRRRREFYAVEGLIGCLVPGSGEDTADAARDRAYAILAVVEDELRRNWDMSGIVVRSSQLTAATLYQGIAEEGRWAALHLTVSVDTDLTSS